MSVDILKKFFDKTFLKFLIVGVINTVFGTAIMFVAYNVFNLSYWFSSFANYFLGSILSYFLNKYYTFRYKKRSWSSVFRFALNIVCCYLVAYGFARPFIRFLLSSFSPSVQDNAAMLLGTGIFMILNFAGQKYFAFRKSSDEEAEKK
ncbi:MAG: GtrA family protein [Bacteroidales bacterium]|nr:GtrA family protein [Bacteroidales bacterium]